MVVVMPVYCLSSRPHETDFHEDNFMGMYACTGGENKGIAMNLRTGQLCVYWLSPPNPWQRATFTLEKAMRLAKEHQRDVCVILYDPHIEGSHKYGKQP